MTSIPVSNVTKNVQSVSNWNNPYEAYATAKGEQAALSFQDAMDMFGSQETIKSDEKKMADANDVYERAQNGQGKVESSMKQEQAVSDEKLSEEDFEKLKLTEKNIVSEISEKLGVSEEEVENAMEQLGFSVFDLLNPNNMALLMTDLLNISDQTMLLTNSELFDTLTDLTQTVDMMLNAVADEIGVSTETLQMQFETVAVQNVLEPGEIPVEGETVSDTDLPEQDVKTSNLQVVTTVEDDMYKEMNETLSETTEVEDVPEEDVEISKTQKKETVETKVGVDTENNVATKGATSEVSGKETHDGSGAQTGQSMNQNTVSVFSNNFEQVAATQTAETTPTFASNTMESILNQIGDYVNINASPDVTSMEIHLTPANLGSVHINIASKNGVITAQITTENEVVKQAIEAQVVQLKERLEGQGVKIEAVEVTVESHEFERNLNENSENREQNEETVSKTVRKKWNLSEMEEESEEVQLTDAEKVELDMMKLKGNQLNYMV